MYWFIVTRYASSPAGLIVSEMSYSVPPGVSVFPVDVIESMCAGVSTPTLVSFCALFARSIWPADAPTPNLLVAACADSAAPFSRSKNPTRHPQFPVVLQTVRLQRQPESILAHPDRFDRLMAPSAKDPRR